MVFRINTDGMRLEKMLSFMRKDQWKTEVAQWKKEKKKERNKEIKEKKKSSWEKYDRENIGEEGKEGGLA